MHGAGKRQPGREYEQVIDLKVSVLREWEAAHAALRRMRPGPLTDRAISEVVIIGIRLAESAAAIETLIAAMGCLERQDEADRRAEAAEQAEAPVRLRSVRRRTLPLPVERPLRSVPVIAVLLGCASAVWRAMKAHAARTATTGLMAAAAAGMTTSYVVLAPHSTATPTGPQQTTILAPAAASPAASVPVLAARGHRKHQHAAAVPSPSPSRHPRRKPHPSPSATASPSATPGTLLVSPLQLGPDGTGTLVLTAEDGPVEWFAVTTGSVTLGRHGGFLAAGESVTLVVRAPGPGSITFSPGGEVIRVAPLPASPGLEPVRLEGDLVLCHQQVPEPGHHVPVRIGDRAPRGIGVPGVVFHRRDLAHGFGDHRLILGQCADEGLVEVAGYARAGQAQRVASRRHWCRRAGASRGRHCRPRAPQARARCQRPGEDSPASGTPDCLCCFLHFPPLSPVRHCLVTACRYMASATGS
jgi:hypothetical protein